MTFFVDAPFSVVPARPPVRHVVMMRQRGALFVSVGIRRLFMNARIASPTRHPRERGDPEGASGRERNRIHRDRMLRFVFRMGE
jgi:hypothetical protein